MSRQVYVPQKDGSVLTIDFATLQRLKKKKEESQKKELELQKKNNEKEEEEENLKKKKKEEQEEAQKKLIQQQKEKEEEEKRRSLLEIQKKERMNSIKYSLVKTLIDIGIAELERQQSKQSLSSKSSLPSDLEVKYVPLADKLKQDEKDKNQKSSSKKILIQKNQNIPMNHKIQEIFQILKQSKLQFQQEMYLNDEINEEILKEKPYSTRNDLSYSVLNSSYKSKNKSLEQKSSFKAAVPCGKLFGRQNLLIEKSDQELQEDLVKIKTQKLKGNSHSPIRKNLEASWKPGNYYPRLFNEEKLLVHDTSPKKFQPHDQYANYIEEIKQINHAVNLEKISDYDEPGYNKLTEEQKKQVKERLYRYDHLEDKSFQKYLEDIKTRTKLPQIEKKNGSLSPRVVKEKGWRPQRTIPITFTENTNRIKKVKNNIMNDQQHNNSTSTQTNSINTSAIGINNHQQQSSEIVKKVKYPKIIDSKEGGKELLKLAKSNNGNRASSPSNNQKKFYQPHFKDLHNYNNQDQFTNKVLNHYN